MPDWIARLGRPAAAAPVRGARGLRTTLLIALLAPLAVLAPLRGWAEYRRAVDQGNQAFDRGLGDALLDLADQVRGLEGRAAVTLSPEIEHILRTDISDTIYLSVRGPDGRLLLGDAPLAGVPVARQQGTAPLIAGVVFFDATIDGRPVRVALREQPCGAGTCELRMAETRAKRRHLELEALEDSLWFFLLLGLTQLGVAWFAVRVAFAPLQRLTDEIRVRSPDDLHPLASERVPPEVRPLSDEINHLFGRLEQAARLQQAFLADAAHQLRTPLTAVRTEAELALLDSAAEPVGPALRRILRASERAARLAAQLLALARSEATPEDWRQAELFDLRQIADQAAVDWVPNALAADLDLGFQLDAAPVRGHRFLLREALDNLIHNAIEYTQPARTGHAARVTVRTYVKDGFSVLEVEDNGPGIPPADRPRVMQRFQRGVDAPGSGSGLGLAIVADIAARHGGQVELLEGSGEGSSTGGAAGTAGAAGAPQGGCGLCVRLRLPHAKGGAIGGPAVGAVAASGAGPGAGIAAGG